MTILAPVAASAVPLAESSQDGEARIASRPWRPPALQSTGTVFLGPPPPPRTAADPNPATPAAAGAASAGRAALTAVSYDWESKLPGWRIRFAEGTGPLRGVTDPTRRVITVYVSAADDTASLARVLAHEIGHAVDLTHNDTATRRSWKERRGMDADHPWWPTPGQPDFSTGSGDFAECFATWQVGSRSRSVRGACSAADIEVVANVS